MSLKMRLMMFALEHPQLAFKVMKLMVKLRALKKNFLWDGKLTARGWFVLCELNAILMGAAALLIFLGIATSKPEAAIGAFMVYAATFLWDFALLARLKNRFEFEGWERDAYWEEL